MAKKSTKEFMEELVTTMRHWQHVEDASVASTARVIEKTDNALIRMVMEIIHTDSKTHYRVQDLIAASLTEEAISLSPDQLGEVWDGIEAHIKLEKQMVKNVAAALEGIKGQNMMIQEYLLTYLLEDEKKHDAMLEALEAIKKGMYPYA